MVDIINPNHSLAKEIVNVLKEKELILDQNADGLCDFLAEGKMKEAIWKKAFENKITSLKPIIED